MKTAIALLLFISLSFQGVSQTSLSPDGKFTYTRSSADYGEQVHWKGSLVNQSTGDTLLIIHNITHDNPAPIAHWSGSRLVFHEGDSIKIYDVKAQKIVYSKPGMIWIHSGNFFDAKHNMLFFFRSAEPHPAKYDLIMLSIPELKDKFLKSFETYGDHITGIPVIVSADSGKRKLIIGVENKAGRAEKFTVTY